MTFPHFSSSSRAGDAFTGRTRASYQAREPIEDDEEGLAMKRAGMPPPLSRRVPNLRIRDDRALQDFSQIRTRCSVLHLMMLTHKHGFDYSRCVSPPTYQCSILFNNMGSFNRKSEFRKPENRYKLSPKVKSSMPLNCHSSEKLGEILVLM